MAVRYLSLEFGARKIVAVLVDEEVTLESELQSFVQALEADSAVKVCGGLAIPYGFDLEWTMDSVVPSTPYTTTTKNQETDRQTATNRITKEGVSRGPRSSSLAKNEGSTKTNNPISTVQLASSSRVLVIHLSGRLEHRIPRALRRFLLDRRFVPVGCNMESGDDAKLLSWHGLKLHHAVDIGKLDAIVRKGDPQKPRGLDKLVEEFVGEGGKHPLPTVAHGYWSVVPLSSELFRYAALDAVATLAVFREMRALAKV